MSEPQAGPSWWSGTGGPEDDLKDIIETLKEHLATAQARADGLALVCAEMRAAATAHRETLDRWYSEEGWANLKRLEAILAAEPEARAAVLVAAQKESTS